MLCHQKECATDIPGSYIHPQTSPMPNTVPEHHASLTPTPAVSIRDTVGSVDKSKVQCKGMMGLRNEA